MVRDAVIVTRPEPGLTTTSLAVTAHGWRAVACPMLAIESLGALPVERVEALLVTSGQALPALKAWPREQKIIAVGEKTAARAQKMGFLHVEAAEGDAVALERYCRERHIVGADVLLVTGRNYGHELAQGLGARRAEVYAALPEALLTHGARVALQNDCLHAVMFYSGRTVDAFHSALSKEEKHCFKAVRALCLSEAIAARLDEKMWGDVLCGDPLTLLGEGPMLRGG
ncbi:uroporphyrinogen-III synthase [Neokomagataea thailandica NBRC 106555]|uniref:Uroporphyrinogen-III synthase n=2 Tax=Neokomagataea TaxID=1223423 RepID=A0A4Y6VBR5_9PROT|nr:MULTISPECIES: uroporphyrinogen-III synthase [Neokomagataea]QDH25946.1 uroporphyrinogen-III synthase [Neokomagataea tanensis]GBR51966.1 uroporphyrinogen-III synthase [Neokomagataea thailandica NBRC 106555]